MPERAKTDDGANHMPTPEEIKRECARMRKDWEPSRLRKYEEPEVDLRVVSGAEMGLRYNGGLAGS